jgi:hypothetical protein
MSEPPRVARIRCRDGTGDGPRVAPVNRNVPLRAPSRTRAPRRTMAKLTFPSHRRTNRPIGANLTQNRAVKGTQIRKGISMPTIKRQSPLIPEGEYCGQARKVSLEWSKPKPLPNGGKSESVQMFRIPLHLPDGKSITKFAPVTPDTGWVFESIIKSGELVAPESEEFVLTPDDLEGRRFYFGVKHEPWHGATLTNVRFRSKTYACQLNPLWKGSPSQMKPPAGFPKGGWLL